MTKPVPTRATGYFHERPTPLFLRGTFSSTWIQRMPEASVPPVIVTPDGTIYLQWIDRMFRVAGPDKDPVIETCRAGRPSLAFVSNPRLRQHGWGVPANQILGQRLSLHELGAPKARGLAGKVRDNQNIAELVAPLESVIRDFPGKNAPTDEPMRAAYNLIQAGPPPGIALVPSLGRRLAMSERTLRRRFDESFGYGPKTLNRILDYQSFLHQARLSRGSTAILAGKQGTPISRISCGRAEVRPAALLWKSSGQRERAAPATNAERHPWRLNGNGELGISRVISRDHTMWRSPVPVAVLPQVGGLPHIISLFLKRIEPREHALVVLPRRRLACSG